MHTDKGRGDVSKWKLAVLVVAMAVALMFLFVFPPGMLFWNAYRMAVPPDSATLSNFQAFLPEAEADGICIIRKDGVRYAVVFGRQAFFNEAPAAYLFDSHGSLVDWSFEGTDSDRLSDYWNLATDELGVGREMTYQDAIAALAAQATK